jgi:hypothetical protein
MIGLVVAVLVIVLVVISAVFGRQAIQHTATTGQWGGVLTFALLCSLISFAALEIVKRLLPVRQYVQQSYLRQWWNTRAEAAAVPEKESWQELTDALGVRSSKNSIFGLPIQLLAAQISNVTDLALTDPRRNPLLYFTLTRSAEDAKALRDRLSVEEGQSSTSPSGHARDAELLQLNRGLILFLQSGSSSGGEQAEGSSVSRNDAQSFEMAQRARASIDSLQLSVGERWRRAVQASAVFVAALAGLLIQLAHPSDSRWLYILAATLIGGPLAWTIRDLAAAIERWRR